MIKRPIYTSHLRKNPRNHLNHPNPINPNHPNPINPNHPNPINPNRLNNPNPINPNPNPINIKSINNKQIIYNISFKDEDDFSEVNVDSPEIFKNVKKIKLHINGEDVVLKKTGASGYTSFYFRDDDKKYFMKIPFRCLSFDIMKREIFILKKLENYDRFPKIAYFDHFLIVFNYIGEVIKKETVPIDIMFQINEINNIFKKEKITHTDIKLGEMLIKGNRLYIVDFGWAKYENIISCNQGFSNKDKPYLDKKTDINNMINIIIKLLNDEKFEINEK